MVDLEPRVTLVQRQVFLWRICEIYCQKLKWSTTASPPYQHRLLKYWHFQIWENLQWFEEEKAAILLTLRRGDTGSQTTTGTLSDAICFSSLEVIHVRQLQVSQEAHTWNVFLWYLHILKVKLLQQEKSYRDSLCNTFSNTAGLFLLLLSGAVGMTHPGTFGSTVWPHGLIVIWLLVSTYSLWSEST